MIKTKDKGAFKRDFERLIRLAFEVYPKDEKLANRYAFIAYKMLLSKRLKLGSGEKVTICKKCAKILIPGRTGRVRLKKGFILYKCLNCGSVRKLGYDKSIRR